MAELAAGIRALSLDLKSQWEDVLVVTQSEFGRTSKENGSNGTDHGAAGVMFAAGGGVNGGVYNCDSTTWSPGDMLADNGRYLPHTTDFRATFAEIIQRHFGEDPGAIEQVIPGYNAAAASDPSGFQHLGFLT